MLTLVIMPIDIVSCVYLVTKVPLPRQLSCEIFTPERERISTPLLFMLVLMPCMSARSNSVILIVFLIIPMVVSSLLMLHSRFEWETSNAERSDLRKEDLIHMAIPKRDAYTKLKWNNHEQFEYQDQLFDVILHETRGDTFHYWVFEDDTEMEYNARIQDLLDSVRGHSPYKKRSKHRTGGKHFSLYCKDVDAMLLKAERITVILSRYLDGYSDPCIANSAPPPETVSCFA